MARTVDTILVICSFSKQALAKYFEITPAFALSRVGFGLHRNRFPLEIVTYAVRRPLMKWKMKDRTARTSST
jgi:hypothetical protein